MIYPEWFHFYLHAPGKIRNHDIHNPTPKIDKNEKTPSARPSPSTVGKQIKVLILQVDVNPSSKYQRYSSTKTALISRREQESSL